MGESNTTNGYAVYVVFTREVLDDSVVIDKLITSSLNENDVLYCRGCFNSNNQKTNRYVCCISKSLYEHLVTNCNFRRDEEFNISKYRVGNESLSNGMTYGFFIRISSQEEEQHIHTMFERFEKCSFINQGSYSINHPTPYPDGSPRGYIIISFEKNEGRYPRQYIKKLKALINNSVINGNKIHVNWVSNSVLRDVLKSESKERKSAASSTN